jgi:hypothetical protein
VFAAVLTHHDAGRATNVVNTLLSQGLRAALAAVSPSRRSSDSTLAPGERRALNDLNFVVE